MSKLICSIAGSRGRSIDVYDNKCVITTDVTLGSLLTSNALDGKKTVFYIDVQGIQFKRSGLTLGYLQLETASSQMNNKASNMFSENTFTYDGAMDPEYNALADCLHDYIADRIESYKYHTPAQDHYLFELVKLAQKVSYCRVNYAVVTEVENHLRMLEQQRQQAIAEQKAQEEAARKKELEDFRQLISQSGESDIYKTFISKAASCARVSEILNLWKSTNMDTVSGAAVIAQKINEAARIERMYGSDARDVKKLLDAIAQMI